ncbi:MAG TPA: hypothetical protein VNA89_07500, partial [Gemmatimonadaceae bacterium]|nr:hypothetical protein [Gemmatimonadaceae bacterium]
MKHSMSFCRRALVLAVLPAVAVAQPAAPARPFVVARHGDLWLVDGDGSSPGWTRLTSGPAWDREPALTPDGRSVVFASDRAGGSDVWRVALGPGPTGTAAGEPERLTTSAEWEGEPAAGPDGRVAFVRGQGPLARVWLRAADGAERRLTSGQTAEHWPAYAPDGGRVALVVAGD